MSAEDGADEKTSSAEGTKFAADCQTRSNGVLGLALKVLMVSGAVK
jgi:hypothetical protein